MTKTERAISALQALPPERREEVAEVVLEIAETLAQAERASALTEEQRAEIRRRLDSGFRRGDPARIDRLVAKLS